MKRSSSRVSTSHTNRTSLTNEKDTRLFVALAGCQVERGPSSTILKTGLNSEFSAICGCSQSFKKLYEWPNIKRARSESFKTLLFFQSRKEFLLWFWSDPATSINLQNVFEIIFKQHGYTSSILHISLYYCFYNSILSVKQKLLDWFN